MREANERDLQNSDARGVPTPPGECRTAVGLWKEPVSWVGAWLISLLWHRTPKWICPASEWSGIADALGSERRGLGSLLGLAT